MSEFKPECYLRHIRYDTWKESEIEQRTDRRSDKQGQQWQDSCKS